MTKNLLSSEQEIRCFRNINFALVSLKLTIRVVILCMCLSLSAMALSFKKDFLATVANGASASLTKPLAELDNLVNSQSCPN